MAAAGYSMGLGGVPVSMDLVGNQCLVAALRGKKFQAPRTVSGS